MSNTLSLKMRDAINIILGIVGILAIIVLVSHFVYFKPEQEKKETALRITKYQICMDDAYETYLNDWQTACKSRGLAGDCMLFTEVATRLDDAYNKAQDTCLELYQR